MTEAHVGDLRARKGLPASGQLRSGTGNRAGRFSLWEEKQIKSLNGCNLTVHIFCGDLSLKDLRQQITKTRQAGISQTAYHSHRGIWTFKYINALCGCVVSDFLKQNKDE
jgi:hypothetical protein